MDNKQTTSLAVGIVAYVATIVFLILGLMFLIGQLGPVEIFLDGDFSPRSESVIAGIVLEVLAATTLVAGIICSLKASKK